MAEKSNIDVILLTVGAVILFCIILRIWYVTRFRRFQRLRRRRRRRRRRRTVSSVSSSQSNNADIEVLRINGTLPSLMRHDEFDEVVAKLKDDRRLIHFVVECQLLRISSEVWAAKMSESTIGRLTKLKIMHNSLRDEGAIAIAEVLALPSCKIEYLRLGQDLISSRGAAAIGEALHTNKSLVEIILDDNSIRDEGAVALANGAMEHPSLSSLGLDSNHIGLVGAKALGSLMSQNERLETLMLSHNHIDDACCEELARGLLSNSGVLHLALNENPFGDDGASSLATALETNNALEVLLINLNNVANRGAQDVARALRKNRSLKRLGMNGNMIELVGVQALEQAVASNDVIEYVWTSNNPRNRPIQFSLSSMNFCLGRNRIRPFFHAASKPSLLPAVIHRTMSEQGLGASLCFHMFGSRPDLFERRCSRLDVEIDNEESWNIEGTNKADALEELTPLV